MIEVRNISKTYGKKKNLFQALKNVSFKIENGSSVAIIGKSGSGLTNFIRKKWDLYFRAFSCKEMKLVSKT